MNTNWKGKMHILVMNQTRVKTMKMASVSFLYLQ